MDMPPTLAGNPGYRFKPIGIIRSKFSRPEDLPPPALAPPRFFESVKGEIVLDPPYAEAADDLEGFSHLVVLFVFHRARGYKLKTVPPRQTRPRGIFSTRSPHRPNPLGMTVVKFLGREGDVLKVSGLDMIDGTPVLDIKPYTRRDRKSRIRTGWIAKSPARGRR
jgi:tRNA-Thr(GGU) m(6)t(6)A37 methyltransferase TsaA